MRMIYMKHKDHGNRHFADAEQEQREAEGWVRWPRTAEQKLGIVAQPAPTPATPDARAALLQQAEAAGVKVDRRWSDARIAAELAKA